jgi:hypothetical protein
VEGFFDSLFGGVPQSVADYPFSFGRRFDFPTMTDFKSKIWVGFGDVGEVIGDAAADVKFRIVFERFEDRERGTWISDEGGNALGPREARAGTFRAEAADMRIRIASPCEKLSEGAVWKINEEWTNGKFGGEALGEFVLSAH